MTHALFEYVLRLGDNCLILGQGVSVWCGHAPALEEDIALANTALDLIGQAKLWLAYAGETEGEGRSADNLAFLRDARAFRNCLLVEQPNGDFGQTLMRQFLFDAWHRFALEELKSSVDSHIAEIAGKASKEVAYHLERSTDLVVRLGDGSDESHERMQNALNLLWPFAGELTTPDMIDAELTAQGVAADLAKVGRQYTDYMEKALAEATLTAPEAPVRKGGKSGYHSEELGYILADMQWLQRAYPGAQW